MRDFPSMRDLGHVFAEVPRAAHTRFELALRRAPDDTLEMLRPCGVRTLTLWSIVQRKPALIRTLLKSFPLVQVLNIGTDDTQLTADALVTCAEMNGLRRLVSVTFLGHCMLDVPFGRLAAAFPALTRLQLRPPGRSNPAVY